MGFGPYAGDQKMLRALIFDLVGTLAAVKGEVDTKEVSSLLVSRGYQVYPQELRYAWGFVVFVDYPKHGFGDYESMLEKMFERLEVRVNEQTMRDVVRLYERTAFQLYPDARCIAKAKELGLRTAIATTTPRFWFENDLKPILSYIDFVCTGYEAGCEKANPKMYKKILERLEVIPKEAAVVGDDPYLDILIPKNLGMRTILLGRGATAEGIPEADAIVSGLNDAMRIIMDWARRTL